MRRGEDRKEAERAVRASVGLARPRVSTARAAAAPMPAAGATFMAIDVSPRLSTFVADTIA